MIRMSDQKTFDYIVVGGGTAGCVMAARLSENPSCRVLLIEAGATDWSPAVQIPMGVGLLRQKNLFDWGYLSSPQPQLQGRRIEMKRGKVLGGSSSTNFMAHNRGAKCDFDKWVELGATEWSYEALLPYFQKSENWHGAPASNRGSNGPTNVQYTCTSDPLGMAILAAAAASGIPFCKDINSPAPLGFGLAQSAIHKGRRESASHAYLDPIRKQRKNLRVITKAHVAKLICRQTRVIGVKFLHRSKIVEAMAEREVIVSSGAFNSPQVLLLSGIGPAEHLSEHGIPVVQDLPGVGKNLKDHLSVPLEYRRIGDDSPLHRMLRIDRLMAAILQAVFLGRGPATVLPSGVNAILKSSPDREIPDLQMLFGAGALEATAWFPGLNDWNDLFYLLPVLARPESTGEVRLKSSNPLDAPIIDPNYLSAENDMKTLMRGFEIARSMAQQGVVDPFRGEELRPGSGCRTASEIEHYVRASATTVQHAACTCRMGNDTMAVVDQNLRVHGIAGLRVVDASVMPEIPGCNINATVLAIAERASDLVKA